MTERQKKGFYFPRWNRAAAAQGWRPSLRGMDLLATRPARSGHLETDMLLKQIWFVALGLADREEREVEVADLRHACHQVATRTKLSSEELNNEEVNRVVALFDLLADPDDLEAMNRWLHPENAARDGIMARLRKLAPQAYLAEISRGKFAVADWESLDDRQLQQLLFTVSARARARHNREVET